MEEEKIITPEDRRFNTQPEQSKTQEDLELERIKKEHDEKIIASQKAGFLQPTKTSNMGRPEISPAEVEVFLQKLRPHLENGSTRQYALMKAEIPTSTFYDLMKKNKYFSELVEAYEGYAVEVANMANMNILKQIQNEVAEQLIDIAEKKKVNPKERIDLKLDKTKVGYLKWWTEKRDRRYKGSVDITSNDKPVNNTPSFIADLSKLSIEQLDDLIKDLQNGTNAENNSDGNASTSDGLESTESLGEQN